jgi:hypothetical protein
MSTSLKHRRESLLLSLSLSHASPLIFSSFARPQEAYARQHSSSSDYSSEIEILDMIAIFLFVFIPLVIFPLIYFWRRSVSAVALFSPCLPLSVDIKLKETVKAISLLLVMKLLAI